MRTILLLALAFLLPSTAMAVPWFDQAWAERLVALEFPDYWDWLQEVREADQERYLNLLHQGRNMALNRDTWPELTEAWETRFYALQSYRALERNWREDSDDRGDEMRLLLIGAAEDIHLANLELFDAKLVFSQARGEQLELQIADHEVNFDVYALDTVERSIGPANTD